MVNVRPIKLEKLITTQDVNGNNVTTVTASYRVFAEVKHLSGSRASVNGVPYLDNVYQFKVRYNTNFNPDGNWRIVCDGNTYTVQSIENENFKMFYLLIKGTSQGRQ